MKNITPLFEQVYLPKKIIAIYQLADSDTDVLIESFDVDGAGRPINAHPLSLPEAGELAVILSSSHELSNAYLKPRGLLPENVLYINPDKVGHVLWYSPPARASLLFAPALDIPCGEAGIPGLIWKASKTQLQVFAYVAAGKPTAHTRLCHAPFFNLYEDAVVCMGTADVQMPNESRLEEFIQQWQRNFFGSYFSHLIGSTSPVQGNIVQLWRQLVGTGLPFPTGRLIPTKKTIKDIV